MEAAASRRLSEGRSFYRAGLTSVDDNNNGNLLRLDPRWNADFYELVAAQKSGLTQYGSVHIDAQGTEMRTTLGYRRYRDCDNSDTPGQDFAVACGDRQYLVGVLADGVGQSFYGNLAAEQVSSWLRAELWRRRTDPPHEVELEEGLKRAEREFAKVIESFSLEHLPDWHRPALEATRRAGSQAVFAAFIWDFVRRCGCLYQVGDATAVVCENGRCEKVEAQRKGRWSSAGKSQLLLLRTPLVDTTAILLKSDGADPGWGYEIDRQTADVSEFLEMANRRADNDDVSFVAGSLATTSTVPREERREPAMQSLGSNLSIYASEPRNSTGLHGAAELSTPQARNPFVGRFKEGSSTWPSPKFLRLLAFWACVCVLVSVGVGGILFTTRSEFLRLSAPPKHAQYSTAGPLSQEQQHVTAGDTLPPDIRRFLEENPSVVIFGIKLHKLAGLRIVGADPAFDMNFKASPGDSEWYVFFPNLQRDKTNQVTLQLHRKAQDGHDQEIQTVITLTPGTQYYPVGGAN